MNKSSRYFAFDQFCAQVAALQHRASGLISLPTQFHYGDCSNPASAPRCELAWTMRHAFYFARSRGPCEDDNRLRMDHRARPCSDVLMPRGRAMEDEIPRWARLCGLILFKEITFSLLRVFVPKLKYWRPMQDRVATNRTGSGSLTSDMSLDSH